MTRADVEAFVESMDNVERAGAFGYALFFFGDDHRLPFVTIVDSDQDFDTVGSRSRGGFPDQHRSEQGDI